MPDPEKATSKDIADICKEAIDKVYGTDISIISVDKMCFLNLEKFHRTAQIMVNVS